MSVNSTSSSSSAPKTSPRPEARPSSGNAQTSAVANSGGTEVKADASVSGGGASGTSSSVADGVSIDRSEVGDTSSASDALLSGLSDNFGVDEVAETAAAGDANPVDGEQAENPYDGIADHTVSMKPEAWTSDRTPAEGDVARNDHLEGMLRNQGFEVGELYKKDENGQTLIDRVAEANGLRNPNLITPEQELVLPSRHEPKAENAAEAVAEVSGDSPDDLQAEAATEVRAENVEDAELSAEAVASATNTGDGGAYADAAASVEVDEAKDSELTARAEATADAASGEEGAIAAADVVADKVVDSTVAAEAVASSDGAIAEADTSIGEAIDSEVAAAAQAEGDGAVAEAENRVGTAENSELTAEARAEGDGSVADAAVIVGQADPDTRAAAEAVAEGEDAEAHANVDLAAGGLPAQPGSGTAEALAEADGDAHGEIRGAADAALEVRSENGDALAEVDADKSEVEVSGVDATAEFEGLHNENRFDAEAEETVTLHDRGLMDSLGAMAPMYSGSSMEGSALGQDLDLRSNASSSVDVDFTGREGDNFVQASLPGHGRADLGLNLGDGTDTASILRRSDDQDVVINKTEGVLNVDTRAIDGTYQDSTKTIIDAGDALLQGTLRGGNYGSEDLTMIRGANFGDLTVDGGQGNNDTFVLDLPEGAAIPAVITREASGGMPLVGWGAREAEGTIPEGWNEGDASIMAPGYENIVIRQNGEIVGQYGGEVADLPEFDAAKAAALQ